MSNRNFRVLIKSLLLLFLLIPSSYIRAQGFTITETLRDSEAEAFVFGGSQLYPDIKAYLTSGYAGILGDPEGDGWLRLTVDDPYQAGSAVVKEAFPSKLGVLVDLEYKIWRHWNIVNFTGADGFSIFLFDALKKDSFQIGGFGGSLGYSPHQKEGLKGLSGGFVGIGLDEYGNYSNPTEGRTGGPGFIPNSLGLRGPSPTYDWLGGNTAMTGFSLQYGYSAKRPADSIYYRRIQIEIDPVTVAGQPKYRILVRVKNALNGKFVTILEPINLESNPPDSLLLGFAASTGADLNFHEVRNLFITTPGGVRVTKQVNKSVANVGDELIYTINIYNQTETAISGLKFKDNLDLLPEGFQVTDVAFDSGDNSLNSSDYSENRDISNITVSLEAFSHATFIVKGTINSNPKGGTITNTAIFNVGNSGVYDPDNTNDTASVTTIVTPTPIKIPNVYTPDGGDEINKYFFIVGLESYDNPRLRISNRWGDEIYYNPNYQNNWDGNGLNEGTYFYELKVDFNGKAQTFRGWVLLKR